MEQEFGRSEILDDERATILYHEGSFSEALEIWERVIKQYFGKKSLDYDIAIWTCRKAGIAAAKTGDWLRAGELFDIGNRRANDTDIPWASVGLLGDAGYAYWRAAKYLQAVDAFSHALERFVDLPDPATDFSAFAVQKLVGNVLAWLKSHLIGRSGDDIAEPQAGMCSDPDPTERLRELPQTISEYCWVTLAGIERDLSVDAGVFKVVRERFSDSDYVIVQVVLDELRIKYALREKNVSGILYPVVRLAQLMRTHWSDNSEGQVLFQRVSECNIPEDLAQDDIHFTQTVLIQALVCLINDGLSTNGLLSWAENAQGTTKLTLLSDWVRDVVAVLGQDVATATETMRNDKLDWSLKTVAASQVAASKESDPDNLFQAHVLLMNITHQTLLQREYVPAFTTLVRDGWKRASGFRAWIRTPMFTVPAIVAACESSEIGLVKVATILLAASSAISMRVPALLIEKLKEMKNSG